MKANTKGWIFVAIQFVFIIMIVVCCLLEKKYLERPYNYYTDFLSYIFLSGGALLMAISFINFGQLITPNPVPLRSYTLKQSGVYSKIRHPIYLAALMLLLGCVFFFSAFYTLVLFTLAVVFILVKIRFEEKQLEQFFPEYNNYQRNTYKLIPYIY